MATRMLRERSRSKSARRYRKKQILCFGTLQSVFRRIRCQVLQEAKRYFSAERIRRDCKLELALRLLANPMDRLHLGMLAKRRSYAFSQEIYGNTPLRELTGITLAQSIEEPFSSRTRWYFQFLKQSDSKVNIIQLPQGIVEIEELAVSFPNEQRALVLQDLGEWKKHWNAYCDLNLESTQHIQFPKSSCPWNNPATKRRGSCIANGPCI